MSRKQMSIISKLLTVAKTSNQKRKLASAVCCGGKILSINSNSHRSKFGSEIRCCGHSEIEAIHSIYPHFFTRKKLKRQYV
jgi:hypothetical protein